MLSGSSNQFAGRLGEVIHRLPRSIPGPCHEWIRRFAPEVVFTMGGGFSPILRLAARIAQSRTNSSLSRISRRLGQLHLPQSRFRTALHRSFEHWFGRRRNLSTVRMTASESMAKEYQQRYGGRFEAFPNLIERFESTPEPDRPCVRLCFIGSLLPNRWQPLHSIAMALEMLRARGIAGELVIYSPPEDLRRFGKYLEGCEAIVMGGTAAPDEVRGLQLGANVLVHVESFDETSRQLTRFSLSTKIPQYLMAGRCIFAVGPAEAASIRYIADSGSGIAVSTDDPAALCATLERLLTNPDLRREFAAQARKTAVTRHEATAEGERFRAVVCEVQMEQAENAKCLVN